MTQPISPSASPVATSASPPSSAVSSPTAPSSSDATTRCRYKTGRCSNSRVVKPNGSLLLLCEYHRNQQNRTKKRSDMKYRHHRAKKRQMERLQPHSPFSAPPESQTQPSITSAGSRPHLTPPSPLTAQNRQSIVSTPTILSSTGKQPVYTPGSVIARRDNTLGSSSVCKKSTLYKISSGLRSAAIGSRISPGKARMGTLRARSLAGAFGVNRRDIVAMASPHKSQGPPSLPRTPGSYRSMPSMPSTPTVGVANTISLVTRTTVNAGSTRGYSGSYLQHDAFQSAMGFPNAPLCLSPLKHNGPWAARGLSAWQPEDVRLLEYFIL